MISQINMGFFNVLKLWPETWVANTAYVLGDVVKPTANIPPIWYAGLNSTNGGNNVGWLFGGWSSYKCTTAGTSGVAEPTWGTTKGGTTTDNTVVWTSYDAKCYQVKAPQGSSVPYVTFGLETEVPIGTFADFEAIENLTYWVNAFSDKSAADVAEIADEVMDALDNVVITATGYTNMKTVREFTGSIIWDLETNIYQVPLRYRVLFDKS